MRESVYLRMKVCALLLRCVDITFCGPGSNYSPSEQSWTSILLALYGAALLAASREFDHPSPPDYIVTFMLTVLVQFSYFRLLSRSDRV
jgi:hypothetical protein